MSNCFKCGRFLGHKEEWLKMETSYGKICYVCYNRYKDEERLREEEGNERKEDE